MKTITISGVTDDVVCEISRAEGKIRLMLIPAHRTRVYSGCRQTDAHYSNRKGYLKSHQESTPP